MGIIELLIFVLLIAWVVSLVTNQGFTQFGGNPSAGWVVLLLLIVLVVYGGHGFSHYY